MAGSQVAVSGLPTSTVFATADILPFVRSGVTDKITGTNFRTQLFAFAQNDPINTGSITAVGNSTITGSLTGITSLAAATATFTNLGSTIVVGDILATDGLYDIGKSGATRFRDGFFSRDLTAGRDVVLTGIAPYLRRPDKVSVLGILGGDDALYSSGARILAYGTGAGATTRGQLELAAGQAGTPTGDDNSILFYSNNVRRATIDSTGRFLVGTTTTTNGVAGDLVLGGNQVFQAASARIIPGATSLTFRNNANSSDNFALTDAGNATLRGNLTFASASTKIAVPSGGVTDFRAASDASSVLSISDTGVVQLSTGRLNLHASSTASASLLVPSGTAPTSPVDGEFWYNGTNLFFRAGVTTKTITWT